ncbi:bcl-2-related protein A1 isoform X2 [Phascolarctos cinereus]|uniref:Bcl-2-related protein A1 n=1 Tax=Phascolarctos cinereus TaxID=38626 RepID=A0A6P5IHF3_PHACI|nr:bcl-2-related protein A1 isoform X2 [Phascolarctos cinereus]
MAEYEFHYVHMLAQDYLKHVQQMPQLGLCLNKTSQILQKVAFSVQEEVEKDMETCLSTLDIVSVDSARRIFKSVMEKEFEDGIINWGRIVTIFAFGGILIKKLLRHRAPLAMSTHEEVSYFIAEFIMNNIAEWIRQNGGWLLFRNIPLYLIKKSEMYSDGRYK